MQDAGTLAGGVAVITGSARGIGKGIAKAAAARGMKLVLSDIAAEALAATTKEFEAAGVEVLAVPTDVSDPAALDRLADVTYERFGSVRLLVNNAGIEMLGNTWELSAKQWDMAIRINVLGPIHGVRAFGGRMVAAQQPAYILNLASLAAVSMMPVQTSYIASKHAVLSFSECLFLEMSRAAPMIRVSVACPGPVDTQIFQSAPVGSNRATVDHHRAIMEGALASTGMSPDAAGETILAQVVAGKFWVATHPEMLEEFAKRRGEHLATLSDPALAKEAEAIL
jgi:NAD(P)-dependent dehydrogenase (short-subunit alcohol dehydrogenase family)